MFKRKGDRTQPLILSLTTLADLTWLGLKTMTIEFIRHFYRATDPGKPLFAQDPEDQKLYIDFSEVRGGKIIEELKDNISFFSPDSPTCSLFTGHIGCGKSTELLRLKLELELKAMRGCENG